MGNAGVDLILLTEDRREWKVTGINADGKRKVEIAHSCERMLATVHTLKGVTVHFREDGTKPWRLL